MRDSDAFVFSLKNDQHPRPVLKLSAGGWVMVKSDYGPAFGKKTKSGFKYEFKIDKNGSVAGISGGFAPSYMHGAEGIDIAHVNVAGRYTFDVDRLEVFTIEEATKSDSEPEDSDQSSFYSDW